MKKTLLVIIVVLCVLSLLASCGYDPSSGTNTAQATLSPQAEDGAEEATAPAPPTPTPKSTKSHTPAPSPTPTAEPSPSPTPEPPPEAALEPSSESSSEPSTDPSEEPSEDPSGESAEPAETSLLEITYLDVGQGDAAFVSCDGHFMLIDGGESSQSSLIYSFLKAHGIEYLDYMIASHPDADHIGGLSGALNCAMVGTALCTTTEHDTEPFYDFVKYLSAQDINITVPSTGDQFQLGSAVCTVLFPQSDQPILDNTSIVVRIEFGETSFLFTGDTEIPDEYTMLDAGIDAQSTVLKVSHHGSENGTCVDFLNSVKPEYAVISVGGDNPYGHPTEAVLRQLQEAGIQTFRTDMQGDIHCVSDGKTVSFDVEKNADADVFSAAGGIDNWNASRNAMAAAAIGSVTTAGGRNQAISYIVNTNTGKFHYPDCSSVFDMKESNKWAFTGTRDELIAMGYSPCGRCHP